MHRLYGGLSSDMQINEHVYAALQQSSALNQVVSDRFYPHDIPDDVELPAIRFNQVSGVQVPVLERTTLPQLFRFQFDVYTTDSVGCRNINDFICAALSDYEHFQLLQIADVGADEINGYFQFSRDYSILLRY